MFVDFLKRKTFDLLTTNKPNTNRAAILELSNMVILVVLDLVILVEKEKNIFETNPRKVESGSEMLKFSQKHQGFEEPPSNKFVFCRYK